MIQRTVMQFLTPIALTLSLAHVRAQTLLLDFGTNTGKIDAPVNGTHWNSGITGTGTYQLQDTSGNKNVATAVLSGTFRTSNNETGWEDRTEVPSWAGGLVTEVLDDRLWQSQNQAGTVTLSGLDPDQSYDIELAIAFQAESGSAGQAPGRVSLSALGGDNPVAPVNARANPNDNSALTANDSGFEWTVRTGGAGSGAALSPNSEGWIGWYGVKPDADGEISITFEATNVGLSRGAFNAMSVTPSPEPDVLLLLGQRGK